MNENFIADLKKNILFIKVSFNKKRKQMIMFLSISFYALSFILLFFCSKREEIYISNVTRHAKNKKKIIYEKQY